MGSKIVFAIALLFGYLAVKVMGIGRRPKDLPPGPPTLPFLGNLHQMPSHGMVEQFQKWSQEYGPIYSLMLGTKVLIVISNGEVWKELLEKRSAIYSDRLEMYVGQTILSGGLRLLMMRYGPEWRYWRKQNHTFLNVNASKAYVPYQTLENKQMLNDMLDTPSNLLAHIQRYTNSLTLMMVYGWRTPREDNEKMQQFWVDVEDFTETNSAAAATLVDLYPVLRMLPESLFAVQRKAKDIFRRQHGWFLSMWLAAKKDAKAGTLPPCLCYAMAEAQEKESFSDDTACYNAGTIFEAGSDTTSSVLYGFVQAMMLFPEVQKKGQEELDKVIGPNRLPTLDDEKDLPYVKACVKESVRWMPAVPLAFTHAVTQDDWYGNYRIPKGSGICPNVWAVDEDPERHPEPRVFRPERYLHMVDTNFADSANAADHKNRDVFSFGAGRRFCQGVHVAERSLFLAISRMLWAFEVKPNKDAQGRDILPNPNEFTPGFVRRPVKYEADIKPRSAERAETIRREWQDAKRMELDEQGQWKVSSGSLKV